MVVLATEEVLLELPQAAGVVVATTTTTVVLLLVVVVVLLVVLQAGTVVGSTRQPVRTQ